MGYMNHGTIARKRNLCSKWKRISGVGIRQENPNLEDHTRRERGRVRKRQRHKERAKEQKRKKITKSKLLISCRVKSDFQKNLFPLSLQQALRTNEARKRVLRVCMCVCTCVLGYTLWSHCTLLVTIILENWIDSSSTGREHNNNQLCNRTQCYLLPTIRV